MRTAAILSSMLAMLTGATHAAVTGFAVRLVDNTVNPVTGQSPLSDPLEGAQWASQSDWFTFDVYVIGTQVGDTINGVNLGGDGAPGIGIPLMGSRVVFNHSLGGNTRAFAFEQLFPALIFDTYACFGGNDTTDGRPTQLVGATYLTGASGSIRFTSFTQPPAALTAGTFGAHAAEIRVLRLTVAEGTIPLDGFGQIGLAGGGLLTAVIPFFPPAPGAAGLALITGAACGLTRRR